MTSIFKSLEDRLDQLEKEPANPKLLTEIGKYLFQLEDFNTAEKIFLRALQFDSKNREIILSLADCYYQLGHYEKAMNVYESMNHKNLTPVEPDLSISSLLQQQVMEQAIFRSLLKQKIVSLNDVKILMITEKKEQLVRTLLNWGALEKNILAYHPSEKFSVEADSQDIAIMVLFSNSHPPSIVDEVLSNANKSIKPSGIILSFIPTSTKTSHSSIQLIEAYNFSENMADIKQHLEKMDTINIYKKNKSSI